MTRNGGLKSFRALLKNREGMMMGSIGRSVYERWVKWSGQTVLTKFPAEESFKRLEASTLLDPR